MFRNVPCPKCGKINQINNISKYIGKKVRLTCLNTACGKEIILDLTNEDSDTTVVVNKINNHQGNAELVQIEDGNTVTAFPITKEENVIGRRSQNDPADIVIQDDPYLSRKHFCIKKLKVNQGNNQYEYLIYELNAKNKTKINNCFLKEGEKLYLKDGDIIDAGTTKLVFNIKN